METRSPRYPNKYLVIGVLIIITGIFALLWTLGLLPSFKALWPLPLIVIGLFFLYIVYFRGKNDLYIIFGMILFLVGIFFLLVNTIISDKNLLKIWPGFMLIAGISFVPYAYKRKRRRQQVAIIIPAISLICLSLIFFLFSLNITGMSLSDFVSKWWPLFIIFLGVAFIVSFFFRKRA
jgi:hypothetical protein